MKPEHFTNWLRGFLEGKDNGLSVISVDIILKKLETVQEVVWTNPWIARDHAIYPSLPTYPFFTPTITCQVNQPKIPDRGAR